MYPRAIPLDLLVVNDLLHLVHIRGWHFHSSRGDPSSYSRPLRSLRSYTSFCTRLSYLFVLFTFIRCIASDAQLFHFESSHPRCLLDREETLRHFLQWTSDDLERILSVKSSARLGCLYGILLSELVSWRRKQIFDVFNANSFDKWDWWRALLTEKSPFSRHKEIDF